MKQLIINARPQAKTVAKEKQHMTMDCSFCMRRKGDVMTRMRNISEE